MGGGRLTLPLNLVNLRGLEEKKRLEFYPLDPPTLFLQIFSRRIIHEIT